MKFIILILFLLCTASTYDRADAEYQAELEAHIVDFLTPIEKTRAFTQRHTEAVSMIHLILEYCEKYDVDPLHIAVLASQENAWKQQGIGALGEIGPLQIMPRWFRQFDTDTLKGQIEAGVWWFSKGLSKCKDGALAYQYYATSKCGHSPSKKSKRRERLYRRAVKKFRSGRTQR